MPDLEGILNDVKPDLVQAGPVQSCGFMTALAGFSPLLIVSWGSDILVDADRDPLWNWMTRSALRHAQWLLCDCNAVREKVQSMVRFDEDRIVQFPWGIDLQSFQSSPTPLRLRERETWQAAHIVLCTRSWEPIYGIDTLLQGFKKAYVDDNCLRLVLLGAGSLADDVERFIQSSDLQDVVFRPGMVSHEELPDYFRAADTYVSCTHSDGASISLLEAMATGLPVVISDIPGNREWVQSGENGWLFEPGNPAELADKLLQSARVDAPRRDAIALANRGIVERRADWDRNIEALIATYDAIEKSLTE